MVLMDLGIKKINANKPLLGARFYAADGKRIAE
jgi:hypothetical protein